MQCMCECNVFCIMVHECFVLSVFPGYAMYVWMQCFLYHGTRVFCTECLPWICSVCVNAMFSVSWYMMFCTECLPWICSVCVNAMFSASGMFCTILSVLFRHTVHTQTQCRLLQGTCELLNLVLKMWCPVTTFFNSTVRCTRILSSTFAVWNATNFSGNLDSSSPHALTLLWKCMFCECMCVFCAACILCMSAPTLCYDCSLTNTCVL